MLGSDSISETGACCGGALGSHLYIDDAPRIAAKAIGDAIATIAELSAEHPEQRMSAPIHPEDAVLLSLQLRDWAGHVVWEDGHQLSACDLDRRRRSAVRRVVSVLCTGTAWRHLIAF